MKIDLFKVFMDPTAAVEVAKVVNSGFIGQGQKVEQFEKELIKHFNSDYVLVMNSCTSALTLAIHLIKDKNLKRDEIIVTPLTCFATISAIVNNGFKVRWADVDPKTCNIDTVDVERKIGPNTRAITIVHWGGTPCNMDHINDIKSKYHLMYGDDLPIIEDCAHCWNSKYNEELIGSGENYYCFSTQAIKFLTTADGGILILPNADIYHRAKLLRWFGLDRDSGTSFRCVQDIKEFGFKYQPTDIMATMGLANLPHMDKNVSTHKENALFYNEELNGVAGVTLLESSTNSDSSYWLYTIRVSERANFIKHLKSYGVEASQVHKRCDIHSCVREFRCCLPGMDELDNQFCCLYGESKIELSNGKTATIRDLVNNKYKGCVKSFNNTTKKIENKKVIGWHKNEFGNRKWVRLSINNIHENGGKTSKKIGVWLTSDHKVLTTKEYKEAQELNLNDDIITSFLDLNEKQKSFIIGSLLGDGHIELENPRFSICHGNKQIKWVKTKNLALGSLANKIHNKGKFFHSKYSPIWDFYRKEFYINKNKIVPDWIKLDPLSLATWFMDDGSGYPTKIILYSQSFSMKDNLKLISFLERDFGIQSTLCKTRGGSGWAIYIGNGRKNKCHNSSNKFFELVSPFIIPCLRYKLPKDISKKIPFDKNLWNLGEPIPYLSKIEKINSNPRKDYKVQKTYCIDVEDNHNFISSGIICHNCIPCGWWVTKEDREYIVDVIKKGW